MRFLFTHRFGYFDMAVLAIASAMMDTKSWFMAFAVIIVGSLISFLSEQHYNISRSDP
ncbi:hypothetical protein [Stutzerimonas stutzeri]|uniref:Uncharacterized protein n=1 Tax=Stutzerimonas stutzeri TaxID=316 RepID=A0AA42TGR2_STUST|nr:hypothetical protein [Stutzerimonas stutzeri]MDH1236490.1 hypothetical protein [Stutzerimonas stutzeri]